MVVCRNMDDCDLTCTFASVVDFTVTALMLAFTAQKQWEIHEVDYSSNILQVLIER